MGVGAAECMTSLHMYSLHPCPLSFLRLRNPPHAVTEREEDKLGRNEGGIKGVLQCAEGECVWSRHAILLSSSSGPTEVWSSS